MQRRWAVIYLVFFLVMAASAYSVMALAEEPAIDIEGDTFEDGDMVEVDGTVHEFSVGDGSGEIQFNETTTQTQEFENGTDIEYRDGTYRVLIDGEEPESFTLEEQFDVEAILGDDDAVENQTVTREDGTESVVYREDGSTEPLADYLPDPNREEFSVGDSFEHDGEAKTVTGITAEAVATEWEGETTESIRLQEGDVITLGETEYVVTFLDDDTVLLSTDIEGYDTAIENQEYFDERISGLLYVVIFSLGSGLLVGALAFLPRRG
ncbi:MAG: hypothetical protein PPP58_05865 [Natronomonas sp.]